MRLGDYFGKHPAILSLVYYNCPMLCSEELDGLASALEMVKLTPGKDFESSSSASIRARRRRWPRAKKAFYLKRYGRPETADGWHFLTGQQPAIDAVTNGDRLRLCARARAGRQARPVRARQLD